MLHLCWRVIPWKFFKKKLCGTCCCHLCLWIYSIYVSIYAPRIKLSPKLYRYIPYLSPPAKIEVDIKPLPTISNCHLIKIHHLQCPVVHVLFGKTAISEVIHPYWSRCVKGSVTQTLGYWDVPPGKFPPQEFSRFVSQRNWAEKLGTDIWFGE